MRPCSAHQLRCELMEKFSRDVRAYCRWTISGLLGKPPSTRETLSESRRSFPKSHVTPSYWKRASRLYVSIWNYSRLFTISLRFRIAIKNWSSYIWNSDSLPDEGNPRTFPRTRRVHTHSELADRGCLLRKLDVTLKVMTREYYRCEMLRWDIAYTWVSVRQMKNCRCAHRTAEMYSFIHAHAPA